MHGVIFFDFKGIKADEEGGGIENG